VFGQRFLCRQCRPFRLLNNAFTKVFQEKQMNELLAFVLDAHGGLDRWNKLKA